MSPAFNHTEFGSGSALIADCRWLNAKISVMNYRKFWFWIAVFALILSGSLMVSSRAFAQGDSPLKPPKGAKIAIVIFEDLECPDCSRANPLLEQAAKEYKIPLVRYDYPLPQHPWAMEAALYARYFDTQSAGKQPGSAKSGSKAAQDRKSEDRKLGDEFRDFIFTNQEKITKDNLRSFVDQFAKDHNAAVPFVIDPQGRFAGEIAADKDLGKKMGLTHTPTIYLVTNSRTSAPFVEVVDRTQLYSMIDALKAEKN
jgi:protein-disulfide isomerase